MNLFTESTENVLNLKSKFFKSQIQKLYKHQSYNIATINKLAIEVDYTHYLFSFVTGDMEYNENFEKELIEISLTHLKQMHDEEKLPSLHYNIIKDGLDRWGMHNKI